VPVLAILRSPSFTWTACSKQAISSLPNSMLVMFSAKRNLPCGSASHLGEGRWEWERPHSSGYLLLCALPACVAVCPVVCSSPYPQVIADV
jgi:hypothetical protein